MMKMKKTQRCLRKKYVLELYDFIISVYASLSSKAEGYQGGY